MQFAVDVQRWADRAGKRVEDASRTIAEAALARVKELTPVRTGTLRASWSIVPLGEEVKTEGGLATMAASTGAYVATEYGGRKLAERAGASVASAAKIGTVAGSVAGAAVNYASGQSSAMEAVGEAGGSAAGSLYGASIGAVGGPVGIAVGGVVGGIVGGALGNLAGGAVEDSLSTKPKGWSIVNPVVYAPFVEYGYQRKMKDGSVKQIEGRHMMTQTMTELPQIATRVLADLNNVG
jgi:phage tail tape-measure protein